MTNPAVTNHATTDLLHRVLRRSFDGRAWHGPALAEALGDVSARTALARPVAGAHSIWDLTHHVCAWTREATRRMHGAAPAMPQEGDWPDVNALDGASDETLGAAWSALRRELTDTRGALLAAVVSFPPERLLERVSDDGDPAPGGFVSFAQMLIGVAEHNAYHGGQIVLLRRAQS